MALKPWYKVVTPREDLREGRPLDASEFAVHLDDIKDDKAPIDYQKPERFFERTYLTKNLTDLSAEVVRRLSGQKVETNAIFNMTTQFGGGKTHCLALLYHLARGGSEAKKWKGVNILLEKAGVSNIPAADTAVFVGQKFDPRGGDDGTPLRRTPWGEIAWQLGGNKAFKIMEKYDEDGQAPGGDTIAKLFTSKKPCLILIDELMNYVSRYRKSGLSTQLYNFLQNLTEAARSHDNVVVAVSIPASELEMSAADESDYKRFKKLLDRLGKAVIMSAEDEISEIIRRRLFEWHGLPDEGKKVATEYSAWITEHNQEIPKWFPSDNAREIFASTYPFHPSVLSVFERKWAALPRFQQTRGVLRLLALWVSKAYQDGYKGAHKDPLITLGTAPLEDANFRAAVFEQLGESRLEGAVTTDIVGKKDAHAVRLDIEAIDTIKKARLHQKTATTIFFESNGGQTKAEATLPEIRLAVAEPELNIGNIETVLETLIESCYFLWPEKNKYRFNIRPNINSILADRRASIQPQKIDDRVKSEIQKIFAAGLGVDRIYYPEKSNHIPDRPALTFVVLSPDQSTEDIKKTKQVIEQMTREYGTSARTFKSALIWCVADNVQVLYEESRKVLAWEDIEDELDNLNLDETQKHQLSINLKKAQRDFKESIWRAFHNVMLLGENNDIQNIDFGLSHSSSAESLIAFMLNRLTEKDIVIKYCSPNTLIRQWPPAFKEWSTRSVRNIFFASPQFPRLLNPDSIRETLAKGVANKMFALVGPKGKDGKYKPFYFDTSIAATDIEISDDMFIITGEEARKSIEPPKLTSLEILPSNICIEPQKSHGLMVKGVDQHNQPFEKLGKVVWAVDGGNINDKGVFTAGNVEGQYKITAMVDDVLTSSTITISKEKREELPKPQPTRDTYGKLAWNGEIQPQKWMNFYTKVLSKYATGDGLKITLKIEIAPSEGVSKQKAEDTKVALKELGLDDKIDTE